MWGRDKNCQASMAFELINFEQHFRYQDFSCSPSSFDNVLIILIVYIQRFANTYSSHSSSSMFFSVYIFAIYIPQSKYDKFDFSKITFVLQFFDFLENWREKK
jgi:hypothetical protein